MHCEDQFLGICFVIPAIGSEQTIFKFADFIAALALLVIVYIVSDVRYRFRLAIAPTLFHLYVETYFLIGVIGFGTLLTDVWVAERWLVPESLITASIWRGMFAAMFLSLAMTWMWYAFIRPPIFGKKNYNRYANSLYFAVIKGSSDELPIIANELGRSANSLIKYARQDKPVWDAALPQRETKKPPKKRKPDVADIAHDVLLLIGNRKLCRHIVESSSVTAIEFFNAVASQKKAGLPLGQFAKNISAEAIKNKDSILYHEDEGFSAGLTGYLKTFSQAIYGNYMLVEDLGSRFGSPLDVDFDLRRIWDAGQLEAYCGAILLTLKDYLKVGAWGQHSYALYRAFSDIESATNDLYLLDKSEANFYSSDVAKRLAAVVEFLRKVVDLFDKTTPLPSTHLKTEKNLPATNLYDKIADMMFEIIFDASAVNSPFHTSWQIQYGSVWSDFFRMREPSRAWTIVQFKLRRLLYDEVLQMDKYVNFKSARILGYCLNVMGVTLQGKGAFGREYRALHRVILAWTQRSYLRIYHTNPKVARACLIGSISYDAERKRLVKTYAEGLETEPDRQYLTLSAWMPTTTATQTGE
jgi:hypothetical protein